MSTKTDTIADKVSCRVTVNLGTKASTNLAFCKYLLESFGPIWSEVNGLDWEQIKQECKDLNLEDLIVKLTKLYGNIVKFVRH